MSESFALPRLRSKRRKPRGPMPPTLRVAIVLAIANLVMLALNLNMAVNHPNKAVGGAIGVAVTAFGFSRVWPIIRREFKCWWESSDE